MPGEKRIGGQLSAILILFILGLIAIPAHAKEPRATFVCAAQTSFDRTDIRVTQDVTSTGKAVGGHGLYRSPALSDAVADPLVALLLRELPSRMADPQRWCTPIKNTEEQKFLEFDCGDETWTDGPDRYSVWQNGWGFSLVRTFPSGMLMKLGWSVPDKYDGPMGALWSTEHYDFQKLGIFGGYGIPPLQFEMPKPWGQANFGIQGRDGIVTYHRSEVGEARVGDRVFRVWSPSNALITITEDVWTRLIQSPGDLVVTAYSTEKGIVARETVPRDIFAVADAQFKQGYARLLSRQRDPLNQCKRVESEDAPPIIIVD